jgi:hypothetical protein
MTTAIRHHLVRAAGILGTIAAVGSLAVRVQLVGHDPGTETYERLNRLWFIALIVIAIAVLVLYLGFRTRLDRLAHAGGIAALTGAASAAAGNAIEFQFHEAQGFMLFGLGLMVFAVGMVALGLSIRRNRVASVRASLAIQAVGVFGFLSSIAGPIGIGVSILSAGGWVLLSREIGTGER